MRLSESFPTTSGPKDRLKCPSTRETLLVSHRFFKQTFLSLSIVLLVSLSSFASSKGSIFSKKEVGPSLYELSNLFHIEKAAARTDLIGVWIKKCKLLELILYLYKFELSGCVVCTHV